MELSEHYTLAPIPWGRFFHSYKAKRQAAAAAAGLRVWGDLCAASDEKLLALEGISDTGLRSIRIWQSDTKTKWEKEERYWSAYEHGRAIAQQWVGLSELDWAAMGDVFFTSGANFLLAELCYEFDPPSCFYAGELLWLLAKAGEGFHAETACPWAKSITEEVTVWKIQEAYNAIRQAYKEHGEEKLEKRYWEAYGRLP